MSQKMSRIRWEKIIDNIDRRNHLLAKYIILSFGAVGISYMYNRFDHGFNKTEERTINTIINSVQWLPFLNIITMPHNILYYGNKGAYKLGESTNKIINDKNNR
jgi:hypothetical protein